MNRSLHLLALAVPVFLTVACGSKTRDRLTYLESELTQVEARAKQEATSNKNALSTELTKLTDDLKKEQSASQEQGQSLQKMQTYLDGMDANWRTYRSLQSTYDNELQQVRDQLEAIKRDLALLDAKLGERTTELNQQLTSTNNDLRGRINRTNNDVLNLREQSKVKLDDMSEALLSMGKGIQSILALQRQQFQSATEAYNQGISDIIPYLPDAMLSTINTPELLKSPNTDLQPEATTETE